MALRSIVQQIGLICLASSIVPSAAALTIAISAAQALGVLQQRASSCPNSTFNSCTSIDPKLPSNFCCPSSTVCLSLDSSSSALCCPSGADCAVIKPITCSIDQQNVALHPGEAVMTTKLDGSLPRCGSNCCPFGYSCDPNTLDCHLIASTSSTSTATASSATGSVSPTSSVRPTTSATAAASNGTGIDSNNPPVTAQCPRFPGAAVAAGFFPGMLAGALLALLGVICVGKSKHKYPSAASSPPSKFSSHARVRSRDGAIIGVSDPIPLSHAARTDFLRRQPEMVRRTGTRMKSWWSSRSSPTFLGGETPHTQNHWKMPTPPVPNNVPLETLGTALPVTPEKQMGRGRSQRAAVKEPSMESIKVYSPASMLGNPPDRATPVKPIRGMASQWRGNDPVNDKVSSFRAPDKGDFTFIPQATPAQHNTDILNPTTYSAEGNGGTLREGAIEMRNVSRPTTTFTDMLGSIGFPDPGPPPMPDVPRGLDVRKKGKRI